MVEFALVLPLIALLLLLAVDFGRVFFGWVGLQNASRIAANYAAMEPFADYSDSGDPKTVIYNAQLTADTTGINCNLDTSQPPQFPSGKALGMPTTVDLTCEFDLLTPFMEDLFGGDIVLNASSTFAIRQGAVGSGGGGGGGGGGGESVMRTVPDLVGMSLRDARSAWSTAGFLGAFSPSSGQDSKLVVGPQTPTPGSDQSPTMTISIASTNAPTCSGTAKLMPKVIGLTVTNARASWEAAGFPATAFDPPASAGREAEVVTDQEATPAAAWATCVPLTTTIVVESEEAPPALCLVPDLVGKQVGNVQSLWSDAGFGTTVQFDPPGMTGKVGRQSIVQSTAAFCDTTVITVHP
jgi:beta-lactam-binding protein with PASTA domain